MLHTFVGCDDDQIRQTVSQPFREYLRSTWSFFPRRARHSSEKKIFSLWRSQFTRADLFGHSETCLETVEKFARIGVNEIACLIDFESILRLRWTAQASGETRRHGESRGLPSQHESALGFFSMSDIAGRIASLPPENGPCSPLAWRELRLAAEPAAATPASDRASPRHFHTLSKACGF
jgi:hypothetical protein